MSPSDKTREKERKFRETASAIVLAEAAPHLRGEPKVWMRRFGEEVTQGDILKEVFKSRIPLGSGKFRIDRRIFHDLPLEQGQAYVVQNYAGGGPMPQDFFLIMEGLHIPRACALQSGTGVYDKWKSELNQERKGKDDFCEYLDGIKEEGFLGAPIFAEKSEFDVQIAPKLKIKVPWTMQLIPLDGDRVLFMYKRKMIRNLWNNQPEKCDLEEFLDLARQMREAITSFGYEGPAPQLSIPVPTISFLAVPELADLIPTKGEDEPFEAPSPAPASKKQGKAAQESDGQTKFCMHCGQKIPAEAKFCIECGKSQEG